MALSKKLRFTLLLALVFSASFAVGYVTIFVTQSAYSMPSSAVMPVEGLGIVFGPAPNSTGIPLNTAITVDAMVSIALDDLHLTPEVPIARVYSEDKLNRLPDHVLSGRAASTCFDIQRISDH